MNILITNIDLSLPTGTSMYVHDLALGLQQKGYLVEVYTYRTGQVSQLLTAAGIAVQTRLKKLQQPDIIHAHHFAPAVDVMFHFPECPVLFLVHDRYSFYDLPPRHPNVRLYAAVDHNCLERLTENASIPTDHTTVLYNWVDTQKFKLRDTFARKPLSALVFSNYATQANYYLSIAAACAESGLRLDTLGMGMQNTSLQPQDILRKYDIVFAKAKSAMEALSTGAAVILCDYRGLGEMVQPGFIPHARKYNFGMRLLNRPFDKELIVQEIKKFNQANNRQTAAIIRQLYSLDNALEELIRLYEKVISAPPVPDLHGNALTMRLRAFLHRRHFMAIRSRPYKKGIRLLSRLRHLFR